MRNRNGYLVKTNYYISDRNFEYVLIVIGTDFA